MSCYVDDAIHPFGQMLMCHLWADALDELYAMVDRIGVQRKWLQQPPKASWVHFDIAKSKRALAISAGAIATDKYGPLEHVARLRGNQRTLDQIADCRGRVLRKDLFDTVGSPRSLAIDVRAQSGPDHVCAVCGADCGFGFGVSMRFGRAGRWSCLEHRDQVERMVG